MDLKIDSKRLKHHCTIPMEKYFSDYENLVIESRGERYIFINNDSKILGVCHTDTVFPKSREYIRYNVQGDIFHFSPCLDDRLGIYAMMDFIPLNFGINLDFLLTENEEIGNSTAIFFESQKSYNWIVEFDRMGLNPVIYQFRGEKWENAIASQKLRIAHGTFSDISELTHLGIMGINWGIGYNNAHSKLCNVRERDFIKSMMDFKRFYEVNQSITFPFPEFRGKRIKKNPSQNVKTELYKWQGNTMLIKKYRDGKKREGKYITCEYCRGDFMEYELEYSDELECYLCENCFNYWNGGGMRGG